MKEIHQIKYEQIIINRVNTVYQNFRENVRNDFLVPKNILESFEILQTFSKRADIEQFGIGLDKTLNDWKTINENSEQLIIINHFLSILQNAVIVLLSIDTNLKKEKLGTSIIKDKAGADVVFATAVQAVGFKSNELLEKYEKLDLKKDEKNFFKNLNDHIIHITNLDFHGAFSKVVENILEFNLRYNKTYKELSIHNTDDLSQKRIELFMDYMNTYYLFYFLLDLLLQYPLNEGMMTNTQYTNLIPNINLYN